MGWKWKAVTQPLSISFLFLSSFPFSYLLDRLLGQCMRWLSKTRESEPRERICGHFLLTKCCLSPHPTLLYPHVVVSEGERRETNGWKWKSLKILYPQPLDGSNHIISVICWRIRTDWKVRKDSSFISLCYIFHPLFSLSSGRILTWLLVFTAVIKWLILGHTWDSSIRCNAFPSRF